MKLFFVRHGEVESKYQKCYNGHNLIGLSATGERQAKKIANYINPIHFDKVLSSDLPRCKATLKKSIHYNNAEFTKRLREKSWGRHEGLSYETICQQDNVTFENFTQWANHLDGELPEVFHSRTLSWHQEVIQQEKHSILVITHAGFVRSLYSQIKKIDFEDAFTLPFAYGDCIVYDSIEQSFHRVLKQ